MMGRHSAIRISRVPGWSLALLLMLAAVDLAPAQQSADKPKAEPAAKSETIPFAEPLFGFEIQLPQGWRYDRKRFIGPDSGLGVLRGERPDLWQVLQILIYRQFEKESFEDWLVRFTKALQQQHGTGGVTLEKWEGTGRDRAILVFEGKLGGYRMHTYYACVRLDPSTIWVLAFGTPVREGDEETTYREQFDQIIASLRITYDPLEAEQLEAAFQRGVAVLEELRAGAASVEIDEEPAYYDIQLAGKSIGYLERWTQREKRVLDDPRFGDRSKDGLRVHEESWRFADDGTVRVTQIDMFSSNDLKSELIENRTTQIPAPNAPSQQLFIELDQCIREGTKLFSSYSTNLDLNLPDPQPPVPIGPRYLDQSWLRLLPKLLRKAKQDLYAFAVYDSTSRALTVHSIRPRGPAVVPGGERRPGYRFEVREGLAASATQVYTDAHGQVVRMESGDLLIKLTTRDDVERRFSDRRGPARARMMKPQPAARP